MIIYRKSTDQAGVVTYALVGGIVCHVFAGDGERFTRLFRETWRAIPAADRRRISRHWRAHGRVWIELIDFWARWFPGNDAQAELRGCKVKFYAPYIDRMSEAGVRYVVAHELAHVLQWADGRMQRINKTEAELDANARALRWLGLARRPRWQPALRKALLEELAEAEWEDGRKARGLRRLFR